MLRSCVSPLAASKVWSGSQNMLATDEQKVVLWNVMHGIRGKQKAQAHSNWHSVGHVSHLFCAAVARSKGKASDGGASAAAT